MKTLLRQLLLLLVAIALPLQGFAAVTMGVCSGEHHGGAVAKVSVTNPQGAELHGHHQDGMTQHDHQHHGSPDKQDKQKTTCAACYAFSLPVSITLTTPALPRADRPVAAASRFTAYQPDGLERPPRSLLA